MSKRMTVVFDDDELYTTLKVESARQHRPAKDIVADALRQWFEAKEDAALRLEIREARAEYKKQGGKEARRFFEDLKAGKA